MTTSLDANMLRGNKNLNPVVGTKIKGPVPHSNDGKCKMIEILNTKEGNMLDASVLKDMAKLFNECVLMYNDGKITIFLLLPSNIVETLGKTCLAIRHISHRVEDVYIYNKSFIMFRNTIGDMLVIPRNCNVNVMFQMFDDFRNQQHFKSASVCVKLEDFHTDIFRNSKCSECLYSFIHYNSDNCVKCHQTDVEETDSGTNSLNQENNNDSRHVSVKQYGRYLHYCYKKVTLPNLTKERVNPLFEEKPHLPTQISADEQRQTNHYEYAISRDHLWLLPPCNYSFTTSKEKPGDRRPRYPEYADFTKRMMSYGHWVHGRPDPTSLSEAGFFFTSKFRFQFYKETALCAST